MKVLITGGYGMLAQDMIREFESRGFVVIAKDADTLDILDRPTLVSQTVEIAPDVIVNCAAWTQVDAAEDDEAGAFALNAIGVQNLASAANTAGARLVHLSTDYVFDGSQETPYQADQSVSPLGAYGRTKAAGEWAAQAGSDDATIVRTAWLYGAGGKCFPKTIARVLKENGKAGVVDDQFGAPTWTGDVARVTADLVEKQAPGGIYHATSSGQTNWFEFTREIAKTIGVDPDVVEPVSSTDFAAKAPRPANSVLGHDSLVEVGVEPIGDWQERWGAAAPEVLPELL